MFPSPWFFCECVKCFIFLFTWEWHSLLACFYLCYICSKKEIINLHIECWELELRIRLTGHEGYSLDFCKQCCSNIVKDVRKNFLEETLHTQWRCSRGRAGSPINKGFVGTLLHSSLCQCVPWRDTAHTAQMNVSKWSQGAIWPKLAAMLSAVCPNAAFYANVVYQHQGK